MAADDGPILASGEDRLDEAELAQAALEGVELVLADPARVGGIGPEVVDRDLARTSLASEMPCHPVRHPAGRGW